MKSKELRTRQLRIVGEQLACSRRVFVGVPPGGRKEAVPKRVTADGMRMWGCALKERLRGDEWGRRQGLDVSVTG